MTSLMSGQPQPKRDRYGRYLLPDPGQPGATSTLAWTRATTFAKAISDGHGLSEWANRMVAKGMAARPDLVARAASVPVEDKAVLGEVAKAAKEAAGTSTGSNLGSALHSFTERVDLGERLQIPAPYDQDVAAYQAALAAGGVTIVPELIERIVVVKPFNVAGTLDRAAHWVRVPDDTLVIGDLKTAKSLDYAWCEIAIQLALYANADAMWDGLADEYVPMPKLDKTRGLVFHLRPGSGRCDLYEVDLAAGWEAAQLCADVRAWRKRKGIGTALPTPPTDAELVELVAAATTPERLAELAQEHAHRWSPMLAAVARAQRAALENVPA